MDRSSKISRLVIILLSPIIAFGTLGDQELSVDGAKLIWNNNSQTFSISASGSMSASVDYIWPVADASAGGQALLSDASGVLSWGTPTTATAHNILSTTHDATTQGVTRGSIIYGNSTPKWDELTIGSNQTVLVSDGTDISWGTVDISGGTNLVAGTNITLSADTLNVDDAFLVNDANDTTTGVLTVEGIGDGGRTSYDLKVGDTTTPDYGMIQFGNAVIGRTSYKAGNINLDGTILIQNIGGPVTGPVEFCFAESTGNSTRFALAKSGVGNATYNPRSMLIAGPAPTDTNFVTVGYWQTNNSIFDNLDCNTAGDGADLGVQNDLEVEGDIFVDSIKESTSGAGISVANDILLTQSPTASILETTGGADDILRIGGTGHASRNHYIDFKFHKFSTTISLLPSTTNLQIVSNLNFPDDKTFNFGAGGDATFLWRGTPNPNYFQLHLAVGSAASSGYFSIVESGDKFSANRTPSASTPNPTLRIYSSDAATEAVAGGDYIEFFHDQNDGVITVGAGDIRLEPADNVIIGGTTPDSLFEVDGAEGLAIETVTGDTTLDKTHSTLLVNASGNVTITLPTAASSYNNTDGIGRIYEVKKIDADADTVTIDGNGSEEIDGATTAVITIQWEAITIQSNGTAWYIL